MYDCKCQEPQYPKDSNGVIKGNVCQKCHRAIDDVLIRERGGFIIGAEKAVADLQLPADTQEELWAILHSKVFQWVRQSYLIANFNERIRENAETT